MTNFFLKNDLIEFEMLLYKLDQLTPEEIAETKVYGDAQVGVNAKVYGANNLPHAKVPNIKANVLAGQPLWVIN